MRQYFPKVKCGPPSRPDGALDAEACQSLLDGMLTTSSSQIFGQRGTPGVEVPLPKRFSSRKPPHLKWRQRDIKHLRETDCLSTSGDCSIALSMEGPPLLATWHEIWGAAVAVGGMCVRSSKLGTAIIQCKSHERSIDEPL